MQLSQSQEDLIDSELLPYVDSIARELGIDPESSTYVRQSDLEDAIYDGIIDMKAGRLRGRRFAQTGPSQIPSREESIWSREDKGLIRREMQKRLYFVLNELLAEEGEEIEYDETLDPQTLYELIIEEIRSRRPVVVAPSRSAMRATVRPPSTTQYRLPVVPPMSTAPRPPSIPSSGRSTLQNVPPPRTSSKPAGKPGAADLIRQLSALAPQLLDQVEAIAAQLGTTRDKVADFASMFKNR